MLFVYLYINAMSLDVLGNTIYIYTINPLTRVKTNLLNGLLIYRMWNSTDSIVCNCNGCDVGTIDDSSTLRKGKEAIGVRPNNH